MTVNDKYYVFNRDNLRQPIQMQLAQKEKTPSEFFFAILKSILNFKRFLTKHDPRTWSISGHAGSEKYG